jgi:hypothetical protein
LVGSLGQPELAPALPPLAVPALPPLSVPALPPDCVPPLPPLAVPALPPDCVPPLPPVLVLPVSSSDELQPMKIDTIASAPRNACRMRSEN